MTVALALSVRRFRDGDEPFIARLAERAFFEYSSSPGASALEMAAQHPTLIAFEGATPVGFVTVELPKQGEPSVIALAVVGNRRGRGIGFGLLCAAERLARLGHARRLRLHTADFNLPALELFLRSGYRIVRRLPRFYRQRFSACELEKTL